MNAEYHVVDCGESDCVLCPSAFRGEDEADAIATARSHGTTGAVELIDVGVNDS